MKLTKRTIEHLTSEGAGSKFYPDDEVPGLYLRVLRSGRKSWVLRYWTRLRRDRLYLIARVEVMGPDEARKEARRLLVKVAEGGDPMQELTDARESPSMASVGEAFLAWVKANRKRNTHINYSSIWETSIMPVLGKLRAVEVTGQHVARLLADMSDRPIMANSTLAVMTSAWRTCQRIGLLAKGPLPWDGQERYPTNRRKRRLSPAEMLTVWGKLDEFETVIPSFAPMIRVIALTGCRLSEWRDALWSWVDLDARLLRLPDSKVGPRDIAIPEEAVIIMRELPRSSIYVFPGETGGPMAAHAIWQRFRTFAGVSDIRIHDLRRTHGSVALECGLNVREVADLLGHSSTRSTEIYLAGVKEREAENVGKVSAQIVAFTRVAKDKKKGLA